MIWLMCDIIIKKIRAYILDSGYGKLWVCGDILGFCGYVLGGHIGVGREENQW
jgi:hypothetical protein